MQRSVIQCYGFIVTRKHDGWIFGITVCRPKYVERFAVGDTETTSGINPLYVVCFCLQQAYVVLGQFLLLRKDQEDFEDWLKVTGGANRKQAGDCYQCVRDWCDAFL